MADESTPLDELLNAALDDRRANHQRRQRQIITPIDAVHVEIAGRRHVNFCSNNYLGLTHHPRVIEAAQRATQTHGAGAAASALISGYTDIHASAERALAAWKGAESAILLPSGYQANHAAVQTIAGAAQAAGRQVRFLLDRLAHASLIDAVVGCGARFERFAHNDLARLERMLDHTPGGEVRGGGTKSFSSMAGDAGPLAGLAALKSRYEFTLLLDE